jgi:cytochrome P450
LRALIRALAEHQQDRDAYYEAINDIHDDRYIFWDDFLNAWVVTGYDECKALLLSDSVSKVPPIFPRTGDTELDSLTLRAEEILRSQFIYYSAGPIGEEGRAYWARALRTGSAEKDESDDRRTYSALRTCSGKPACDLYNDLLVPYTSQVVCERLGIAEDERIKIFPLIREYVQFLDGKVITADDLHHKLASIVSLQEYFLTHMTPHRVAMRPLTLHDAAWVSNYIMVLAAGHESTAFLMGIIFEQSKFFGGLLHLLQTHSNLSALINEALRFDSPVQLITRIAAKDFQLHEYDIEKGQRLFLHIGAANRDRRVFSDPAEFDPRRVAAGNLAFGLGAGHCIGTHLSKHIASTLLSAIGHHCSHVQIEYDRIALSSGLAGREFYRIPGRLSL